MDRQGATGSRASGAESGYNSPADLSSPTPDGKNSKPLKPKKVEKSKPQGVDVAFNFADPQDMVDKLESLDLTEEETEELLKQAYKINRSLKDELRNRTLPEPLPRSVSSVSTNSRGHMASSLPPLQFQRSKTTNKLYGAKLTGQNERYTKMNMHPSPVSRQGSTLKSTTPMRASASQPRGSEKAGQANPKPPKDKKSGPKPEWDDRFNCT